MMTLPQSAFTAPTRGSAVGAYLLGSSLGHGAAGRVFSAWDRRHGRAVALKLAHEPGRDALEAEARALAAIDDPRVVRLVDFGPWRDRAFLAMELVDGRTLDAWIAEEPAPDQVLGVLAELGRAIEVVHRSGYVHGDIKPKNVHVTGTGEVRLMDFGLATEHQRARAAAGTPAYLAPEVFDGGVLSRRSDQFAFAVVVYESLAGARPFTGRNWIMQVLDPVPPAWGAIPQVLRESLGSALRPQPHRRLDSVRPLIDALEAAR